MNPKIKNYQLTIISLLTILLIISTALPCLSQGDTWEMKAPMTDGRFFTGVCELDGKIYVIGGQNEQSWPNARSVVEIYDPATDSWSTTTKLPVAKSGAGVCVLNGKIYVMGGRYGDTAFAHTNSVYEFDPATETWAKKTAMPRRRSFFHVFPVDGKIYAIGGRGYEGTTDLWPTAVDIYDPVADTWSAGAAMPMPINRNWYAGAQVNGKIYIIAGEKDFTHVPTKTVFEYDVAQNSWSRKKDVPTPSFTATAAALNGIIYVMGGLKSGSSSDSSLNVTEEYDPETDTWIKRANMPIRAAGPCCIAFDNKIYVMGGIPQIDYTHLGPGGCGEVTEAVQVYTPPAVGPFVRFQSFTVDDHEGNKNANPDAGETVKLSVSLRNIRFGSVNTSATLRCNDPDVHISQATAEFGQLAHGEINNNNSTPFELTISSECQPHKCMFYLDISGGGQAWADSFQMAIGNICVLLVDDDGGADYQGYFSEHCAMACWDACSYGCLNLETIQKYDAVVWFTGDDRENTLTTEEQTLLADYLDNGGNLLITGQDIGYDLVGNGSPNDGEFFTKYLHANYLADSSYAIQVRKSIDDPITDGIVRLIISSNSSGAGNQAAPDVISPISPAEEIFYYYPDETTAAIKHQDETTGSRLIYLAFGFEGIAGNSPEMLLSNSLSWLLQTQVIVNKSESRAPTLCALAQNYPNPFNPTTTIDYTLPQAGQVTLSIYNLFGQHIQTLVNDKQNAGTYSHVWNATDETGNKVSSGIYLYRIEFTDITGRDAWRQERKMLLLK
jgi:N-acetylneuraminic acid mutarotase